MPSPLAPDTPPWVLTVFSAMRRQHRFAVLTGVLLLAVAALASSFWPRSWQAEATLLVAPQNVPEQYVGSVATANVQERLSSISKQVLSAPRLEKLIEAHQLYTRQRRYKTREEIIELMRSRIDITLERNWSRNSPGSFRIRFTGESPQQAAEVTAQIGSFFIEENYRTREDNALGTSEFLTVSISRTRAQLDGLEQRLAAYKRAHPGSLPQQEPGLRTALAAAERGMELAEERIFSARQARSEAESLLLSLEGLTHSAPVSTPAPPAAAAAPRDAELERMRAALSALELRYHGQHPDIVSLRDLIAAREKQVMKNSPVADEPPVRAAAAAAMPADLAARLSMLRQRRLQALEQSERAERDRERYAAEARSLREQIAGLPVNEQELAGLLRDYDTTRAHYQALLDKRFQAELAADLEHRQKAERFVMLDPPRAPEKFKGPSRLTAFLLMALACVPLAVALSVARESRAGRVLGGWELDPALPVLARLPGGAVAPSRLRWWEITAAPVALAICCLAVWLVRQGVI